MGAVTYLVDGRRGTTGPDLQTDSDDRIKTVKEPCENVAKLNYEYLVRTVMIKNGKMHIPILRKCVFRMSSSTILNFFLAMTLNNMTTARNLFDADKLFHSLAHEVLYGERSRILLLLWRFGPVSERLHTHVRMLYETFLSVKTKVRNAFVSPTNLV